MCLLWLRTTYFLIGFLREREICDVGLRGTRRSPFVTSGMEKEGPRYGTGECKRGGVHRKCKNTKYTYLIDYVCSTLGGLRLKTRKGHLDRERSLWDRMKSLGNEER